MLKLNTMVEFGIVLDDRSDDTPVLFASFKITVSSCPPLMLLVKLSLNSVTMALATAGSVQFDCTQTCMSLASNATLNSDIATS